MPASTPHHSLDHYARLVRRLLRVPIGLVTLVTGDEQVFAGADGVVDRRGPLTHSFCHLVVTDDHPLVVNDCRRDERLSQHPAVTERGVGAYAGWPLYDAAGTAIGSLCAVEHGAREWSTDEVNVLRELALGCSAELQRGSALDSVLEQLAALERELEPALADRLASIRRGATAGR